MKSGKNTAAIDYYTLAFGFFLGLCIVKFGDPVILDQKILPPESPAELWRYAWPTHWANWIFFPLAAIGVILMVQSAGISLTRSAGSGKRRWLPWLFVLPLLWFGWQLISSTQTIDPALTATSLAQFFGCVVCYFLGAFLFKHPRLLYYLLPGILAGLLLCLIRATDQHIEFPQSRQFLLQGEHNGWTNFPPAMLTELERDQTVIRTNGTIIINPALLTRFTKGRVMGTMVYPNALAGVILLLFPASVILLRDGMKKLRPAVRAASMVLVIALGTMAFFWSGSKFGWLIAIFLAGVCLFRLRWPVKWKILAVTLVAVVGLAAFALRFHNYFAHGATSAVARLDYWRAAVQITAAHPWYGTGPGTFQHPYAILKAPDAEMARLTHNDYLEQFCDSGIPGGVFFLAWICGALVFLTQKIWKTHNHLLFAVFLGLLGWFIQALGEFELFIPALAWTAFILLGSLLNLENPPANNPRRGAS